jgi:hypothetical protein
VPSSSNTFYTATMKGLATNVGLSDNLTWSTSTSSTIIPAFLDGALNYVYTSDINSEDVICALYTPDKLPNLVWAQSYNNLFKPNNALYQYYFWFYAGAGCHSSPLDLNYCNGGGCNTYPKDYGNNLQGRTNINPNLFWQEQMYLKYQSGSQVEVGGNSGGKVIMYLI